MTERLPIDRIRHLRRLGWSGPGIARQIDADPELVAAIIGTIEDTEAKARSAAAKQTTAQLQAKRALALDAAKGRRVKRTPCGLDRVIAQVRRTQEAGT